MPEAGAALVGIGTAKGPYSPALRVGSMLFVSGQVALLPDGSSLGDADFETQARQCLANLHEVLASAGASLAQVAKVTVFIADLDAWPAFNRLYAEAFGAHRPARSMVPVPAFPGGFKLEIEAVAVLDT